MDNNINHEALIEIIKEIHEKLSYLNETNMNNLKDRGRLAYESNENLYQALCKAQGEIRSAEFDGKNPYYKSNYSTLAAVVKVCRQPLAKNGLSVMQIIDTVEGVTYLKTRLAHISGEYIESKFELFVGDLVGDKKWHAIGSAITYARRYALSALLGIISGSDEDDDGNKANEKVAKEEVQFIDEYQRDELLNITKPLSYQKYNILLNSLKISSLKEVPFDKFVTTAKFLKNFVNKHSNNGDNDE